MEPTRSPLPRGMAMTQVAMSLLTCLQRQQLPLVLDDMTAVEGVHLQLHIPLQIPEGRNKTCQHQCNYNHYNDLYEHNKGEQCFFLYLFFLKKGKYGLVACPDVGAFKKTEGPRSRK